MRALKVSFFGFRKTTSTRNVLDRTSHRLYFHRLDVKEVILEFVREYVWPTKVYDPREDQSLNDSTELGKCNFEFRLNASLKHGTKATSHFLIKFDILHKRKYSTDQRK